MIINLINEKYCFGRTMVSDTYYSSIFRFVTNASDFVIHYEIDDILFKTQPHMGVTMREGIAIMYRKKADTVWLPLDVFARTTTERVSMTHLIKDEDYEVIIYGPATAGLKKLDIEVSDNYHFVHVKKNTPRILCVGGIHTVGAGCVSPQFSIPAIISRRLDAKVDVQAFYMNNYVGHLPKAINGSIDRYGNKIYDIVLFEGDYIRQDDSVIEESFHNVITTLSSMTDHIVVWSSIPESKKEKSEYMRELAMRESSDAITCDYIDCSFVFDEAYYEMCTFSQNFINETGRILIYNKLESHIKTSLSDVYSSNGNRAKEQRVKRPDTEDPMVSIVILVNNMGRFFRRTIESILNQTMKNFELICVNNGSTDDSLDIILNYADKDERIVIVSNDMLSCGEALNNGIELACGKYVLFLGADDFFEPDMLDILVKKAEKESSEIVLFPFRRYNPNTGDYGFAEGFNFDFLDESSTVTKDNFPKTLTSYISDNIWTKLYLRSFLEKNDLTFQKDMAAAEYVFSNMSLYLANNISWVPDALINHREDIADDTENQETLALHAIEAEKKIYDELHNRKIYGYVEQSYVNHAADLCARLLEGATAEDSTINSLNSEMVNSFFPYTHLLEHEDEFFYLKDSIIKIRDLKVS